MHLEVRSGKRIRNLILYRLLDNIGLVIAPGKQINTAGFHNRIDAHRNGTRRQVVHAQVMRRFRTGSTVHKYQARNGSRRRAGLVHGDIPFPADAHQDDVQSAVGLDALFIQQAMVYDRILRNRAVRSKHVLPVDVHLVQEKLIQLADAAAPLL